jgi:hypothetical protein
MMERESGFALDAQGVQQDSLFCSSGHSGQTYAFEVKGEDFDGE